MSRHFTKYKSTVSPTPIMTPINGIDTNNDDQLEYLAETIPSSPTHNPLSSTSKTKTSGDMGSPKLFITKQASPEAGNDSDPCDLLEAPELECKI
ncbi:hypothetical protein CEK25_003622 [Fusarium fujikuroi]|nr:hypothetical protein CEK25_003622 [Fusarium fujikuroi]